MGINISISPPVSGTPRVLFRGCHPHEHCPCIWFSGTVQILPVLPVSLFHGHDSIDTYAVFLIVYPEENGELPGDMHAIPDNTFPNPVGSPLPGLADELCALTIYGKNNKERYLFKLMNKKQRHNEGGDSPCPP